MGPADRPFGLCALQPGLQHHPWRALRGAAPYPQPLQPGGERLLHLRPGPLRVWVRRQPEGDTFEALTPELALEQLGERLRSGSKAIGIGSPRASLEANYALRAMVGQQGFFSGVSARESRLGAAGVGILSD